MSTKLKCVFCALKKNEKVQLFSEETMKKCRTILRLRKFHNLKYKDVDLDCVIYDSGYHRSCYKTFTALKRKFYETGSTKKNETSVPTSESSILLSESLSIEKPSTSANSSLIADAVVQGTSVENINIPVIDEVVQEDSNIQQDALLKNSPVTANIVMQDSSVENIDIPISDEIVERDNNVQLDASLKDKLVVDSELASSSSDIPTSKDVFSINMSIVCFFCNKKQKKFRSKILALHTSNLEQFKPSIMKDLKADTNEYNEIAEKLQNITDNKAYYHNICRNNFRNKKILLSKSPVRTSWHSSRENHQIIFKEISDLIEENVVRRGRCYFLSFLYKQYLDSFRELNNDGEEISSSIFRVQYLEEKIRKKFAGKIKILQSNHKKIIAPHGISSIDDSLFTHLKNQNILQAAASILRNEILNVKKSKLPDNLNNKHLKLDECSIPLTVSNFVASVIGGYTCKRRNCDSLKHHVNSLSQDLIYKVHNDNHF